MVRVHLVSLQRGVGGAVGALTVKVLPPVTVCFWGGEMEGQQ